MQIANLDELKLQVDGLTKGKNYTTINIKVEEPPKLGFELLDIANTTKYKDLSIQDRKKIAVLLYTSMFLSNKMDVYTSHLIQSKLFIQNILSDFTHISLYSILLDKAILILSVVDKFSHNELLQKFFNNIPKKHSIWTYTQLNLLYKNQVSFYEELVKSSYQTQTDIITLFDSKTNVKDNKYLEPHIINLREIFWTYSRLKIKEFKNETDILFILKNVIIPYQPESANRLYWLLKNSKNETYKNLRKPLLEFLKDILGDPADWSKFPNIDNESITLYQELAYLIKFKYFEMIAQIVYEHYPLEKNEMNHLNNRTVFWRNYETQIKDIKIYLPEGMLDTLVLNRSNYQNADYSISDYFIKQIGTCEIESPIVLIYIDNLLIVEFFQGSQNDTIILDNLNIYDHIKVSTFNDNSLDYLKTKYSCLVKHRHGWMTYLYRLLRDRYQIIPSNKNYFLLPMGFKKQMYFSEHEPKSYTSLKDSTTDKNCAEMKDVIICNKLYCIKISK